MVLKKVAVGWVDILEGGAIRKATFMKSVLYLDYNYA